jgi:superfamily I DNA/RNA helicase
MEWERHIVNKPFRFISGAAISRAFGQCLLTKQGLIETLDWESGGMTPPQRRGLEKLHKLIDKLRVMHVKAEKLEELRQVQAQVQTSPEAIIDPAAHPVPTDSVGPADMIKHVLKETQYIEELRKEEGLVGMDESKVAALSTLHYMATYFKTVKPFIEYIDNVSLAVKQAKKAGLRLNDTSTTDALVLSTIHRFKGLETENVFLIDVNDGRFPHQSNLDQDEELRLLYVAITRARNYCQVSYSAEKADPGEDGTEAAPQSKFIHLLKKLINNRD